MSRIWNSTRPAAASWEHAAAGQQQQHQHHSRQQQQQPNTARPRSSAAMSSSAVSTTSGRVGSNSGSRPSNRQQQQQQQQLPNHLVETPTSRADTARASALPPPALATSVSFRRSASISSSVALSKNFPQNQQATLLQQQQQQQPPETEVEQRRQNTNRDRAEVDAAEEQRRKRIMLAQKRASISASRRSSNVLLGASTSGLPWHRFDQDDDSSSHNQSVNSAVLPHPAKRRSPTLSQFQHQQQQQQQQPPPAQNSATSRFQHGKRRTADAMVMHDVSDTDDTNIASGSFWDGDGRFVTSTDLRNNFAAAAETAGVTALGDSHHQGRASLHDLRRQNNKRSPLSPHENLLLPPPPHQSQNNNNNSNHNNNNTMMMNVNTAAAAASTSRLSPAGPRGSPTISSNLLLAMQQTQQQAQQQRQRQRNIATDFSGALETVESYALDSDSGRDDDAGISNDGVAHGSTKPPPSPPQQQQLQQLPERHVFSLQRHPVRGSISRDSTAAMANSSHSLSANNNNNNNNNKVAVDGKMAARVASFAGILNNNSCSSRSTATEPRSPWQQDATAPELTAAAITEVAASANMQQQQQLEQQPQRSTTMDGVDVFKKQKRAHEVAAGLVSASAAPTYNPALTASTTSWVNALLACNDAIDMAASAARQRREDAAAAQGSGGREGHHPMPFSSPQQYHERAMAAHRGMITASPVRQQRESHQLGSLSPLPVIEDNSAALDRMFAERELSFQRPQQQQQQQQRVQKEEIEIDQQESAPPAHLLIDRLPPRRPPQIPGTAALSSSSSSSPSRRTQQQHVESILINKSDAADLIASTDMSTNDNVSMIAKPPLSPTFSSSRAAMSQAAMFPSRSASASSSTAAAAGAVPAAGDATANLEVAASRFFGWMREVAKQEHERSVSQQQQQQWQLQRQQQQEEAQEQEQTEAEKEFAVAVVQAFQREEEDRRTELAIDRYMWFEEIIALCQVQAHEAFLRGALVAQEKKMREKGLRVLAVTLSQCARLVAALGPATVGNVPLREEPDDVPIRSVIALLTRNNSNKKRMAANNNTNNNNSSLMNNSSVNHHHDASALMSSDVSRVGASRKEDTVFSYPSSGSISAEFFDTYFDRSGGWNGKFGKEAGGNLDSALERFLTTAVIQRLITLECVKGANGSASVRDDSEQVLLVIQQQQKQQQQMRAKSSASTIVSASSRVSPRNQQQQQPLHHSHFHNVVTIASSSSSPPREGGGTSPLLHCPEDFIRDTGIMPMTEDSIEEVSHRRSSVSSSRVRATAQQQHQHQLQLQRQQQSMSGGGAAVQLVLAANDHVQATSSAAPSNIPTFVPRSLPSRNSSRSSSVLLNGGDASAAAPQMLAGAAAPAASSTLSYPTAPPGGSLERRRSQAAEAQGRVDATTDNISALMAMPSPIQIVASPAPASRILATRGGGGGDGEGEGASMTPNMSLFSTPAGGETRMRAAGGDGVDGEDRGNQSSLLPGDSSAERGLMWSAGRIAAEAEVRVKQEQERVSSKQQHIQSQQQQQQDSVVTPAATNRRSAGAVDQSPAGGGGGGGSESSSFTLTGTASPTPGGVSRRRHQQEEGEVSMEDVESLV